MPVDLLTLGAALLTGLLALARVDGLAVALRVALGAMLLLVAARLLWPRRLAWLSRAGGRLWTTMAPLRTRGVPAAGPLRPWLLGLFWGWLPCGLSTTMLAVAWLEADALHSAFVMLAFGLGTTATMVPVTWAGARAQGALATRGGRVAAAMFIALAGIVTLAAPFLAHAPAVHSLLAALGCRSLPA